MWSALKKKVSKSSGANQIPSAATNSGTAVFRESNAGEGGLENQNLQGQPSDAEESDDNVEVGDVATGSRTAPKVTMHRYKKISSFSDPPDDVSVTESLAISSISLGASSQSPRRENPYAEMTPGSRILLTSGRDDVSQSGPRDTNGSWRYTLSTSGESSSSQLVDNAIHLLNTTMGHQRLSRTQATANVVDDGVATASTVDLSNNNHANLEQIAVRRKQAIEVGGVHEGEGWAVDRTTANVLEVDGLLKTSDDDNANMAGFDSRRPRGGSTVARKNVNMSFRISPPRMKRREKTPNRDSTNTSSTSANTLPLSSSLPITSASGSSPSVKGQASWMTFEPTASKCPDASENSSDPHRSVDVRSRHRNAVDRGPEVNEPDPNMAMELVSNDKSGDATKSGGLSSLANHVSVAVSDDEEEETSGGAGDYCRLALPEARPVAELSVNDESVTEANSEEPVSIPVLPGLSYQVKSSVSQDDDESGYATLNDTTSGAEKRARKVDEVLTKQRNGDGYEWQGSLRTSSATTESTTGTGSCGDDFDTSGDCSRDLELDRVDSVSPSSRSTVWIDGCVGTEWHPTFPVCDQDVGANEPLNEFVSLKADVDTEPRVTIADVSQTTEIITENSGDIEAISVSGLQSVTKLGNTADQVKSSEHPGRLVAASSDESFSLGTMTSEEFRRVEEVFDTETTTAGSMTTTTTSGDDSPGEEPLDRQLNSTLSGKCQRNHSTRRHRELSRQESSSSSADYYDISDDQISTLGRSTGRSSPPPPPPPRNHVASAGTRRAVPVLPDAETSSDRKLSNSLNSDGTELMKMVDTVSSSESPPVSRNSDIKGSKITSSLSGDSVSNYPFLSTCSSTTGTDDDDAMISIELNDDVLTIAEPTHMSWHEVMQSAQVLGIPLHRMPTAAASATLPPSMSASWSQPVATSRSDLVGCRRASLSSASMTSSERSYAASPMMSPSDSLERTHTTSVGDCPSSSTTTPCHRRTGIPVSAQVSNVEESPSPKGGSGRSKKTKSTNGTGGIIGAGTCNGSGSGTSPFRAKLQNFFSRKPSDENRSPDKLASMTHRKEMETKQAHAAAGGGTGNGSHSVNNVDRKSVVMRRPRDGRQSQRHQPHQQHHIDPAQHQRCSPCRDTHPGRAQTVIFDHRVSQTTQLHHTPPQSASSHRVQSWTPLMHASMGSCGGGAASRTVANGASSTGGTGSNGVVGMYRGSMLSVLSSSFSSGSLGSVFSHASSSHSGSHTSSSAAAVTAGSGSGSFTAAHGVGRQMSSPSSVGWKNNCQIVGRGSTAQHHGGDTFQTSGSGGMSARTSYHGGINRDESSSPSTTSSMNADFIDGLRQLKDCEWYWGPITWQDATAWLTDLPDGSFLIRDSSDERYILSLSFRSQGATHHTRIEHYKGQFGFYSQPSSSLATSNNSSSSSSVSCCNASNIVDFVDRAVTLSHAGQCLYFLRPRIASQPPVPVQLLYPVARPTMTANAASGGGCVDWAGRASGDLDGQSLQYKMSSSAATGCSDAPRPARRCSSQQPASLRQLCHMVVDGEDAEVDHQRRRQQRQQVRDGNESPPPVAPPRRRSAAVTTTSLSASAATTPSRRDSPQNEQDPNPDHFVT